MHVFPAVEDAYLLVLDVIAQLKSEQTMNRVQAAFLYRNFFGRATAC
jgi:hypothetical protein